MRSTIFVVPVGGGEARRVAEGRSPTWSPDGGQIAFLGPRAAEQRLWWVRALGGVPRALTPGRAVVSAFTWSPDARSIAAVIAMRDSAAAADRATPARLAIINLGTGRSRDLATGDLEPGDPAWAPTGNEIAFSARGDIYLVSAAGGSPRVVVQREGLDVQPRWSPDGSRIAFASGQGVRRGLVRLSVVAVAGCPTGGCVPLDLGKSFDGWIPGYPPNFFAWSADGRTLYVSAIRRMTQLLYALPASGGEARVITPGRQAYWSFSVSRDGRAVAFLASDSTSAGDVVVSPLERFAPRRLTNLNPWLAGVHVGAPEVVRWTSLDGLEVEGLLLKPIGFESGRRYPLLVQMEGTYGTYDLSFSGRVAADNNIPFPFQQQVFASAGYAVLMPNPRGSWGYGEDFALRGRGDFGTGPVIDIASGVQAMIERGIADSARVGIMGTGYDAYRALLALTQTDHFKAASVDGPLYDLVDLYETMRPDTSLMVALIGGSPASAPDEYARISPANFADRLRVPTLVSYADVTHGLQALQVRQARLVEAALRKNGVPVEVVAYRPTPGVLAWGPRALTTLVAANLAWFQRWIPAR